MKFKVICLYKSKWEFTQPVDLSEVYKLFFSTRTLTHIEKLWLVERAIGWQPTWQATVTEVIFAQKRGEKYSMQNVKNKIQRTSKDEFWALPAPLKKEIDGRETDREMQAGEMRTRERKGKNEKGKIDETPTHGSHLP